MAIGIAMSARPGWPGVRIRSELPTESPQLHAPATIPTGILHSHFLTLDLSTVPHLNARTCRAWRRFREFRGGGSGRADWPVQLRCGPGQAVAGRFCGKESAHPGSQGPDKTGGQVMQAQSFSVSD
jgi:hypothetical protein